MTFADLLYYLKARLSEPTEVFNGGKNADLEKGERQRRPFIILQAITVGVVGDFQMSCFLDAASEFYYSPEIAILKEKSGVMMVVHNYWEELIAWFKRLIYFAIQYSKSGGDAAAFVGHNAFLRWSALQEFAYKDETDNGRIKYWSEDHVSENFEMSLKLQSKGYIVRLVTYHNDQFQEGVSLTVYDELTRWQKYAYGCSELVFRPVWQWHTGKIFTPLFSRFLQSDMQQRADSVLKCGQEGSLEPGVSLSGQRQAAWYTAGSSSSSSTGGKEEIPSRTLLYADSPGR
ncbi:glycosyl transferase family group 2-domain-containing protein [Lipomyces starkeyi]